MYNENFYMRLYQLTKFGLLIGLLQNKCGSVKEVISPISQWLFLEIRFQICLKFLPKHFLGNLGRKMTWQFLRFFTWNCCPWTVFLTEVSIVASHHFRICLCSSKKNHRATFGLSYDDVSEKIVTFCLSQWCRGVSVHVIVGY